MTSSTPLQPGLSPLPPLKGLAPAPQQLARLLDALLILQVQRRARVADLAAQVGLGAGVLRKLLSSYMVAAADAVGPSAPLTLVFGTADGPLSAHPRDDDEQAGADVVHLVEPAGASLLDDVGRRPVPVEDVARALLAARAVLDAGALDEPSRSSLEHLVERLSSALGASVTAPFDAVAQRLRDAVRQRHPVSFRYRDPWTGGAGQHEVQPYDVRRLRQRIFLDAGTGPGGGVVTFDLSGISDVEVDDSASFESPELPPAQARAAPVEVVLEVPDGSPAEHRLRDGWGALIVGPPVDGRLRLRLQLDPLRSDTRLGVLLLQLGPGCLVVSPPELRSAAVPIARRLLATLPPAGEVHG